MNTSWNRRKSSWPKYSIITACWMLMLLVDFGFYRNGSYHTYGAWHDAGRKLYSGSPQNTAPAISGDTLPSDECFISGPFNMAFQVLLCHCYFSKRRQFGPARQSARLPEIFLEVCGNPGAGVDAIRDRGHNCCDFYTGIFSLSRIAFCWPLSFYQ